jgi:hypothetical protein
MKAPQFTLDDIKHAENAATYRRAQELYRYHKVEAVTETAQGYRAIVQGTHPYQVSLSRRSVDQGDCTCYLGQHDRLCKHILALALAVLNASGKMDEIQTQQKQQAPTALEEARPIVNAGMRKLKHYTGPSRIWFSYQRSLATGAGMIAVGVSGLPPTKENARYLWKLITRIDQKLVNGVDDSDGVVGECAMILVEQLSGYAKKNAELEPLIRRLSNTDTNFDFAQMLRAGLG